jgi:hypothetical protein
MNKIKIKLFFGFLLCLQPIVTSAASNVWTDWYPVGQVYTYSDGSFFLALNPTSAHPNPAGCVSSSWLRIMPDQLNFQQMYQMALTAQAAGLKINAYVSGTACSGSYLKPVHLRSVQ